MPEFVGGQQAMIKYLTDNIKYPEDAKKNAIVGTTYLGFVVEKDGSISNIQVKNTALPPSIDTVQTVNPTTYEVTTRIIQNDGSNILDKEAIRVVQTMPKWSVGKKKGQAVRTEFILPVKFELEKKDVSEEKVQVVDPVSGETKEHTIKVVKNKQ